MALERLSKREARDAIYLDFEGEGLIRDKLPMPALAGTEINGSYVFWIFDERLRILARARRGLPWSRNVTGFSSFLNWITTTAKVQGRRICFFSEHEKRVVSEHADDRMNKDFEELGYNGKLLIERWYRKKASEAPVEATLSAFAEFAALKQVPAPAEGVGRVIRRLRDACDGERRLSKLAVRDRQRWVSLIKYNRNDCLLTRRLVKRAANYLSID